jgi:hypothetical protein
VAVSFFDGRTGWALSQRELLVTHDGGLTSVRHMDVPGISHYRCTSDVSVGASSTGTIFAVTDHLARRSSLRAWTSDDAGRTWRRVLAPPVVPFDVTATPSTYVA